MLNYKYTWDVISTTLGIKMAEFSVRKDSSDLDAEKLLAEMVDQDPAVCTYTFKGVTEVK